MKKQFSFALGAALCVASGVAAAADWSDTSLSWRYGQAFREPFNAAKIQKHIFAVTHVRGYQYGSNFLNVDLLQSDSNDPGSLNQTDGAQEAYVVYRHTLDIGKLRGEEIKFGPVRGVGATFGFDWNTKNNAFQSRKRMFLLGPTLKLAVPVGFVDVSLYYAREWNHCGLDACDLPGNQSRLAFDPFYQFNVTWGVPFSLDPLALKFQGFYSLNGKKGDDYRNNPTANEQLMRSSLMLDVGHLMGTDKNVLWVGPGYEYWRNKFGNRSGDGIDVDALSINLEWHL